ncbi:MAG TPA: hypothetical protein VGS27_21255 [Candidatus Sulfotelmatobacter sp.]|nr:hypothetical protein [Candidatus Sulfotelmatobacter sp.]
MKPRTPFLLIVLLSFFASIPIEAQQPFKTVVYIPVQITLKMKDRQWLETSWAKIHSQVHVDKVYLETYRSRVLADEALVADIKKFFQAQGVEVSGAICYSDDDNGQFTSFTYTKPEDREYVKHVSEMTAKLFDEVILDDFFFANTKRPSDIAAKGDQSWTDFRLKTMDEVSRDLVVNAARAVNPKVKMIIKFPNWYEHFQGNGYDLGEQPKIFDEIYTGTETRDPVATDQNLQQYEGYEIMRYFDEIAPGRNGGGWVDVYAIKYADRYSEQLWLTVFGKAKEMTLFNYGALLWDAKEGDRPWKNDATSVNWNRIVVRSKDKPIFASVAGDALDQIKQFTGKLGNPIGIASYRPVHAVGEDFLHNFLGMIGIPIEMYPTFPEKADVVLLTQGAADGPNLVSEIKQQLDAGKTVVVTSGLWHALEGKGAESLDEIRYTDHKVAVTNFIGAFGAGPGGDLGKSSTPILIPHLQFLTNDAWPIIRGIGDNNGFPIMLMNQYGKGTLYVLTIPENFTDLYLMPDATLNAIRSYVLGNFPVRIEAPSKVSIFAYDNGTFIVESFRDEPTPVTVLATNAGSLSDLVSDQKLTGTTRKPRHPGEPATTAFTMTLAPHSYRAFQINH